MAASISYHELCWRDVLSIEPSPDSPIAIKIKTETRVTIEQKQLMKRAASLHGQNLRELAHLIINRKRKHDDLHQTSSQSRSQYYSW